MAKVRAARRLRVVDGGRKGEPRPGSISLVGAGPGDPELLTLAAVARIAAADVIYYDALIGPVLESGIDRSWPAIPPSFLPRGPRCWSSMW